MNGVSVESPASPERLARLWDDLAELERPGVPGGVATCVEYVAWHLERAAATYALLDGDGALLGVAFVFDLCAGLRFLCFTKTQTLVARRRIAFARSIPALLRALAARERARGAEGPLVMHRPVNERDARWFLRCGCTWRDESLLLVPDFNDEGRAAPGPERTSG